MIRRLALIIEAHHADLRKMDFGDRQLLLGSSTRDDVKKIVMDIRSSTRALIVQPHAT